MISPKKKERIMKKPFKFTLWVLIKELVYFCTVIPYENFIHAVKKRIKKK